MTEIDNEFAAPASSSGFSWEDHLGCLLIVEPTGHEEEIPTHYGTKPAIRARISVVDGTDTGEVIDDALVFPRALIGQLRPMIGRRVLGRLTQGTAKPGQQAPWLLAEATAADIAAAKAFAPGTPPPSAPAAATVTPEPSTDPLAGVSPEARAALAALAAQQQQP